MFSASERVLYGKRQLIEVICQLRFPTILSISAKEPAEFQEAIRAEFPRYARNLEKLPPKVIGQPGAMKLEEQPTVVNYQFLTAAGDWKVNLTNTFLLYEQVLVSKSSDSVLEGTIWYGNAEICSEYL